DLARPVIEVRDYKTGRLQFEIYSFGQDVVITPIKSKGERTKGGDLLDFSEMYGNRFENPRIDLDVEVKKNKIILFADPRYASQNINIYADGKHLFSGSLSRNGDITLSLSRKEGQKILKNFQKNKDIYAQIK
ncbi:MAG: hypothetical protein ACTSUN_07075, partial [Promethearchaeota archaeon]